MSNELDPRVRQWYRHLDKGQPFYVTAVDANNETVEVQHFDGNVEEFTFSEWDDLDIAVGEAPANWTGPQDAANRSADGDVTDTSLEDWNADLRDQHTRGREHRPLGRGQGTGSTGTAPYMDEGLMEDIPASRNRNRVGNFYRRADGVYLETFDDTWTAEYAENPETGLWQVDMLRLDASHWRQDDLDSLEVARKSALEFYNDNAGG